MTSVVSICNLALSHLGKGNVSDLTEASAEARACNQFYEHARDTLLQAYPWKFAGKTASLAQVANDKAGAWDYAYARPSDCLKIRWLSPSYDASDSTLGLVAGQNHADAGRYPYEIEGATIYVSLSPAFLRYTWRIDDTARFPPLFVDALSLHLAARMAMALTRDPKTRSDTYKFAIATQALAEMADANEQQETADFDSDFVEARA